MRNDERMAASSRVAIVGGGIVAASVAYHLARRGSAVLVFESEQQGRATDAGAGIICPWTALVDDARYRLSAAGAAYYPELLAQLATDGRPEVSYAKVGTLCVSKDADLLTAVAGRMQSRVADWPAIGEVELIGRGEPAKRFPPLDTRLSGVWISGGARVDGRSVRDSLMTAAEHHGATLISATAVLDHANGKVRGVLVGSDRFTADAVVVAAGAWTGQVCECLGVSLPIGPQRGQIVHVELADAQTGNWPVVLADDDHPYLLGFPGGRVVLGATTEDVGFDHAVTVRGLAGLLAGAMALAPGLAPARVLETRVGFRPVTPDGSPLLGRMDDGLVVAAGNGPEGLTAGPWMGRLAAELALGEQPEADISAFDPSRN
jgi:D-amino-acid dehydrogenase